MPQRIGREFMVERGDIVDTTPEGSIRRTGAFANAPHIYHYDASTPGFAPGPGLFGGMGLEQPRARVDPRSLEQLAEIRARRRADEREREERLRAQARQRNEAFNEQAARNVRRRTTSEGQVLGHVRASASSGLFGNRPQGSGRRNN